MNYKQPTIYSIIAIALLSTLFSMTTHARVKSIKKLNKADGSKSLLVSCSTRKHAEVLIKKNGTWCDTRVESLCGSNELRLANKVCSNSYQRNLKATQTVATQTDQISNPVQKNVPQVQSKEEIVAQKGISELRQEALDTQELLLEIKEKQLELKRKELHLRSELETLK